MPLDRNRDTVMRLRFSAVVAALILLVAACQPAVGPSGPDTRGAAVTLPCDPGVTACTAEQLRAWEQAEHTRIERRAAESAAAFDEATRLWHGGLLFSRDDDDDDGPAFNPSLLQCQPQRYQAAARIIGPDGGTVVFGPHSLRIPAGALDHEVVITGEIEVSRYVLADLSPHGLTFTAPAVLELGYLHCRANVRSVRVAYVDNDLTVLEYPGSFSGYMDDDDDDEDDGRSGMTGEIYAHIWHFSKYAVAY